MPIFRSHPDSITDEVQQLHSAVVAFRNGILSQIVPPEIPGALGRTVPIYRLGALYRQLHKSSVKLIFCSEVTDCDGSCWEGEAKRERVNLGEDDNDK